MVSGRELSRGGCLNFPASDRNNSRGEGSVTQPFSEPRSHRPLPLNFTFLPDSSCEQTEVWPPPPTANFTVMASQLWKIPKQKYRQTLGRAGGAPRRPGRRAGSFKEPCALGEQWWPGRAAEGSWCVLRPPLLASRHARTTPRPNTGAAPLAQHSSVLVQWAVLSVPCPDCLHNHKDR
ncbi:hypothetical protein NDU88_000250 [Pleurodeles waltl]|uniref:Uncharacterized protein n=1 Tax=Pleurodeles waltl TaxID=8319 RepID=A0AAV7KT03_PLEWA|nr:hypothetical protein NDU88_000250 [Pleurodeles waltl]